MFIENLRVLSPVKVKVLQMNIYDFISFEGDDNVIEGETKNFTQDEVNAIMAKEKRKTQEAQKQLLDQLEQAKKIAKEGTDGRVDLEKRIDELQKLTMSAEERSRQKETKLQKQFEDQISSLNSDRDEWKNRHTDLLVSNAILRAASTNKAVEPNQLLKMLKNDVRVVQNEENSNFEIRMNLLDTDKDGKPIELDLPVDEAVKRMTELPHYGNLFEGGKAGGVGGNNQQGKGSGKIDIAKLAREDPVAYRELRRKNPAAIYGS